MVKLSYSQGLPADGITIFGSQLHTHATGRAVVTRHFDSSGKELPEINRDDHYSTHFQEIRGLRQPRKVMPVRREKAFIFSLPARRATT